MAGKLSDAEALYRDALEARKHVLGDSHPDTLASINNLASCFYDQGIPWPLLLFRDGLAPLTCNIPAAELLCAFHVSRVVLSLAT